MFIQIILSIMNVLTKYVILNISELVLEYTKFAGVLKHKIKTIMKNIEQVILNEKTNEIIMSNESEFIQIINLNTCDVEYYNLKKTNIFGMPEINHHILKYAVVLKVKNIFVLHGNTHVHIVIENMKPEPSRLEYIINFDKLKKFFITEWNNNSEEKNEELEKINFDQIEIPEETYMIIDNCHYIGYTSDENTIICGFNNKIIRFYDAKTLNKKSCIIDFDMNTKKYRNYFDNKINGIYYLNQYFIIWTHRCIYIYEICNNDYIFKTFIVLIEPIDYIILFSPTEIVYSESNGICIYNLVTQSTERLVIDEEFYDYGILNSKIIFICKLCIKICTYDSCLKKSNYITIKGDYNMMRLLSNSELLFCGQDSIIVNVNSSKIIKNLKLTCDDITLQCPSISSFRIKNLYYFHPTLIPIYEEDCEFIEIWQ
jgi:hypothetical protein